MSKKDIEDMFQFIKTVIGDDCPLCKRGIGVVTADYVVQYSCGYSAMPMIDEESNQWILYPLSEACLGVSNLSKIK